MFDGVFRLLYKLVVHGVGARVGCDTRGLARA